MAKRRHEEEQQTSSKTTMALMALGGVIVGALVVWALTRTVQPAPEPVPTASVEAPVTIEQPAGGAFPTVTPTSGTTGTTVTTGTGPTSTPINVPAQVPPPAVAEDPGSVTRINVADLRAKVDAKQVTVIDVRDKTSYMGSHIPGALHIPAAQMESQVSFLPKDKPIVTYCT